MGGDTIERRNMSDTESARGDSIEEEEIVINEDETTNTDLENGDDTVVTVITRNVKEVSWPPADSPDQFVNSTKTLPNLSGVVHIGKDRRQKMELALKDFQGSTAQYSRGGFQPNKMKAAERWKPE